MYHSKKRGFSPFALAIALFFALLFTACKKDQPYLRQISGTYQGISTSYSIYEYYDYVLDTYYVQSSYDTLDLIYEIEKIAGGDSIRVLSYAVGSTPNSSSSRSYAFVEQNDSVIVYEERICAYHCNYKTFSFTKEAGQMKLNYAYYDQPQGGPLPLYRSSFEGTKQ